MFFILSNYNKKVPFSISKSNALSTIENHQDELKFASTEANSPVQFFCAKQSGTGMFQRKDLVPAKYFAVQLIFEKDKDKASRVNDVNTYTDLITAFGGKKAKERLEKRALAHQAPAGNILFNVENQLLPAFNKDAESPKDIYATDLMFEKEIIEELSTLEVDVNELSEFVRGIYREDLQLEMLLLDCLYKLVTEKTIFDRTLGRCRAFYDSIKGMLVKGRLPRLVKDKCAVKFYIVLLSISGFEFNLDQVPKLFMPHEKIMSLLKMIGCSVTKGNCVKLEGQPKSSYKVKRQRL